MSTYPGQDDKSFAIICNGLTKYYGTELAVDNISLKIKYGSIFGLLGPNGAGKTSVIKMLTGLSVPTKGDAYVADHNIRNESYKVKQNIGWISSEVILDESLTTMENIWLQSKLQGLDRKWKPRALELLDYFELLQEKNKKTNQLSTGMKKKLEIIMALIHNPKILFMDEPTIGLDASTRRRLWNLIKEINKNGVTILLTTHYIEEADALCDELAIINHGKIITTGSPEELKAMVGEDRIEIDFNKPFDYSYIRDVDGIRSILDRNEKKEDLARKEKSNLIGFKLLIKVSNAETTLPKIISIISENHPNNIKSIRIEKPSLEAIFLDLTGKRIDEAEQSEDRKINSKTITH